MTFGNGVTTTIVENDQYVSQIWKIMLKRCALIFGCGLLEHDRKNENYTDLLSWILEALHVQHVKPVYIVGPPGLHNLTVIGSGLIILLGPHKVTVIEKYRSTVWLHWTGFSVRDF